MKILRNPKDQPTTIHQLHKVKKQQKKKKKIQAQMTMKVRWRIRLVARQMSYISINLRKRYTLWTLEIHAA